ncbi:hypothetical protein JMM63_14230 [Rhodovulum sulfidophilum]|uniref:hypothetical protein n=1 Tax=Rhodovulum sulfidophilum TaxID=35806 RepID=UPI001923D999|nr:hypothetical protein [Rhodovulum sulfidophilum]MBL3596707.1 hypothetical protein [Rhodovulum sulfidophilum]
MACAAGCGRARSNRFRADRVETVIVNDIPAWIVLVALIGWIAPSPGEIGRRIGEAVTRRRD